MHKSKIIHQTQLGSSIIGDSAEEMKKIGDNKVDLILTSPPFALTKKKSYGNVSAVEYLDWFDPFADEMVRTLSEDGSIVIDLGGAFAPGQPTRVTYQWELLLHLIKRHDLHLCQEFYHYNPARLPSPAQWVNIERIRVKDSVNVVWWLSKTTRPKANNRNVLTPYSESMKRVLQTGKYAKGTRPSGHKMSEVFAKDNNGAIPSNLLTLANTSSNDPYMRACRRLGLKPHPARFPPQFAEFFVKFLTCEGDLILDPFAGSNTTGFVADQMKRQWISIELDEAFATAGVLRFEH